MENTLHLTNRLADLAAVEAALADMTGPGRLSQAAAGEARLVLEEAFTNIVKYAHPDGRTDRPVVVRLALEPGRLVMELIDEGVAFDPFAQNVSQLDRPFAERVDGLMGIPLIQALVPDCRYRRENGRNHLELRLPLPIAL
jgi:serine/threonine-protein kinase RsbW